MIRYADIINESVVDGLGLRLTVFLQGCPRRCNGCHNPELLPMAGGKEISEEDLVDEVMKRLSPLHRGVTFSGGDPLAQPEALYKVLEMLRSRNPRIDIWVYTGYMFEDVRELALMSFIDVLVDGPFMMDKKDIKLAFRGSSNQRIIDVPRSLASNKIILVELE